MTEESTLDERLAAIVDQLGQLEAERDAICARLRQIDAQKKAERVQLAIKDFLAVGAVLPKEGETDEY